MNDTLDESWIFQNSPQQFDFFEQTASQIIAERGAVKPKVHVEPAPKVEPEPEPLPTTLAGAYARGFDEGYEHLAGCCGCSMSVDQNNPYDGTPL